MGHRSISCCCSGLSLIRFYLPLHLCAEFSGPATICLLVLEMILRQTGFHYRQLFATMALETLRTERHNVANAESGEPLAA